MSDERRHRRFYEKRQFERAIASEVRADRKAILEAERHQEDITLLCRRHRGSLSTRKWVL